VAPRQRAASGPLLPFRRLHPYAPGDPRRV